MFRRRAIFILIIPALAWLGLSSRPGRPARMPARLQAGTATVLPTSRPCEPQRIPETVLQSGDECLLNVAPRDHDPGRGCPEGWCGETALQEALLYHGGYFPQKEINKAGRPSHPDLYSNDIPVALDNLHVRYRSWPNDPPGLPAFLEWIRGQIKKGVPVFVGVKIYPTQHEDWGLDHFVNVAGFSTGKKECFTFNTTWGLRETRTAEQLASTEKGYAFKNKHGRYYGISITGPAAGKGAVGVRLFVLRETKDAMDVIVKCEGLTSQAEYVIHKSSSYGDQGTPFAAFKATGAAAGFYDTIDKKKAALYRCRIKDVPPAGGKG